MKITPLNTTSSFAMQNIPVRRNEKMQVQDRTQNSLNFPNVNFGAGKKSSFLASALILLSTAFTACQKKSEMQGSAIKSFFEVIDNKFAKFIPDSLEYKLAKDKSVMFYPLKNNNLTEVIPTSVPGSIYSKQCSLYNKRLTSNKAFSKYGDSYSISNSDLDLSIIEKANDTYSNTIIFYKGKIGDMSNLTIYKDNKAYKFQNKF